MTPMERTVVLPADVRAIKRTNLYAKTSGYLKSIKAEIGDVVKAGQVLATIESPETDQQVSARQAEVEFLQHEQERMQSLGPGGVVSQQQVDRTKSDLDMARAELARLKSLQAYQVIRAPFDGVITARRLDEGALVQPSVPLLEETDPKQVKIMVNIGQDVAPFIKVGDPISVLQDERPDLTIKATLTRMSASLDSQTRTMLAESWVNNQEYKLQPGSFVRVMMKIAAPPLPIIPSEALTARGKDLFVAVLKPSNKVSFSRVETGLNDGITMQIRSGLSANDVVILNPPGELIEGDPVQPIEAPKKK